MDAVFFYAKKYYFIWMFVFGMFIAIYYLNDINIVTETNLKKCYIYYSGRLAFFTDNNRKLYFSVILGHLEEVMVLYFISYTYFEKIYSCSYFCYKGFCHFIYFCIAFKCYGIFGFLIYFATIFPQCMVFAPLSICCVIKGKEKNKRIATLCFLIASTVFGGFIEVFVGYRFYNFIEKIL